MCVGAKLISDFKFQISNYSSLIHNPVAELIEAGDFNFHLLSEYRFFALKKKRIIFAGEKRGITGSRDQG